MGAGPEESPADLADLSTTPPRLLQFHPSIQFITIPDTPVYPIMQTLRLSPPVIGLPIPNPAATPTYILGELSIHIHSSDSCWVQLFTQHSIAMILDYVMFAKV